jgi:hypothetical protein
LFSANQQSGSKTKARQLKGNRHEISAAADRETQHETTPETKVKSPIVKFM